MCSQPARQNHALAANAAVFAHHAAQFIESGGEQFPLPGHADFTGIVPEITENTPAAHIHIIADDRIANVAEMRHKDLVAQQAALHLHRVANDAVIADAGLTAQIGVRTNAATGADAHMPLNHRAGQHH